MTTKSTNSAQDNPDIMMHKLMLVLRKVLKEFTEEVIKRGKEES